MDEVEILKSTGLSKYESLIYQTLVKNGILTAKELSRIGNVPMGKIYEVLSSLEEKGFLEIQKGRPILYRPVKPSIAFKEYYNMKKKQSELEFNRLKETIAVINQRFPNINRNIRKERVFVSSAMGKDEIIKGYFDSFNKAEKEIFVLNSVRMLNANRTMYHQTIVPISEVILKQVQKGIKVYIIDPGSKVKEIIEEKIDLIKEKDKKEFAMKNIEIKIKKSKFDYCLIDDTLSIIDIEDPIEDKIMAIMKIYDIMFNKRLKKKFLKIWANQS
jgi:sugar-specific transcriptional regulator TrmB